MTLKKGGTTQGLLFPYSMKNSSNSTEWREHELQFAKSIAAIAPITSMFEELKAIGNEYKPSIYKLGSLYQEYTKLLERTEHECLSCIHLLKDNYQSERRKVLQQQTSSLEHLFKQFQGILSTLGKFSVVRQLLKD